MKLPAFGMAIALLAGPVVAAADQLDDTFQFLKQAVEKKDPAMVKKLALEISPLVKAVVSAPQPDEEEAKALWAGRIEYAKAAGLFAEYGLFAVGIQSAAETMVDLISTLEEQNPKSQYLDQAYGPYLLALKQTGASAKIPAVTERALANFPDNEDLILVMIDTAVSRKQSDRALTYANRLAGVLSHHPKPENMTAAEWERKRNASLAHAYWTAGAISFEKGQYVAADKNLRALLPLIAGNSAMAGQALFQLGVANYQLGKMTASKAKIVEAAKLSEQSAAIEGPFAEQARHNALVMKQEAAQMR
ncbi:MAG TPA: hypothetical protein VGF59_09160 [Bryobacteraceae bacterium]